MSHYRVQKVIGLEGHFKVVNSIPDLGLEHFRNGRQKACEATLLATHC